MTEPSDADGRSAQGGAYLLTLQGPSHNCGEASVKSRRLPLRAPCGGLREDLAATLQRRVAILTTRNRAENGEHQFLVCISSDVPFPRLLAVVGFGFPACSWLIWRVAQWMKAGAIRSCIPCLQVCLACLLPLFLIPVVNALPLLFYFIVVSSIDPLMIRCVFYFHSESKI